jgi:hypothetical protein
VGFGVGLNVGFDVGFGVYMHTLFAQDNPVQHFARLLPHLLPPTLFPAVTQGKIRGVDTSIIFVINGERSNGFPRRHLPWPFQGIGCFNDSSWP